MSEDVLVPDCFQPLLRINAQIDCAVLHTTTELKDALDKHFFRGGGSGECRVRLS